MYCNECGAKLDDDALVCPNCGHQVLADVVSEEEPVLQSTEPTKPESRIAGLRPGAWRSLAFGRGYRSAHVWTVRRQWITIRMGWNN